jgi:hypothetical protein
MEKIIIKPVSHEILVKGTNQEGHADLFAYDSEKDATKRGLGNLFIVGNIQDADGDESDVAYVTNLVASLAKREYYLPQNLSPREAMTAALKKINDVVDEFFKNKNLQINIGIFAVAEENILISKLGKFKIFLARDGRTIDILNNVDLFERDRNYEQKFSNIVSGKVHGGDRILAFYPSKSMAARERFIKADFVKYNKEDFIGKINALKDKKKEFGCAALYIDINKHKEATIREKAKAPKSATIKLAPEMGTPILAAKDEPADKIIEPEKEVPVKEEIPAVAKEEPEEMPQIIPAEFLRAKKGNPLGAILKRVRISDFNPRKKTIKNTVISLGAVLIVVTLFWAKSLIVTDPNQKIITDALQNVSENIGVAKDKISSNKFNEARSILSASLASIKALPSSNAGDKTVQNIAQILDSIDGAVDANLTLSKDLSQNSSKVRLINIFSDKFGLVVNGENKFKLARLEGDNPLVYLEIAAIEPKSVIFSSEGDASILLDAKDSKLNISSDTKTRVVDAASVGSLKEIDFYQDNLYILGSDKIYKITDIVKGGKDIRNWSQDPVAQESVLMAVDGSIYLLDGGGKLVKYFRGKKEAEFNIQIPGKTNDFLLTTKDSKNLYLISNDLGRIYTIDKERGKLIKSAKLNTMAGILDATIAQNEAIYILTSDNKIWLVN